MFRVATPARPNQEFSPGAVINWSRIEGPGAFGTWGSIGFGLLDSVTFGVAYGDDVRSQTNGGYFVGMGLGIAVQIATGAWAANALRGVGGARAALGAWSTLNGTQRAALAYTGYALLGDAIGVGQSGAAAVNSYYTGAAFNPLNLLGFAPTIGWAGSGAAGLRAFGKVGDIGWSHWQFPLKFSHSGSRSVYAPSLFGGVQDYLENTHVTFVGWTRKYGDNYHRVFGHAPSSNVRVFRVEGTPNSHVVIGEGGMVAIKEGNQTVFFNFGSKARAEQYLAQKIQKGLPGATVKSFEVPRSFLDDLRASAIDEDLAKILPNRPFKVDITMAPDQFGLRSEQIEALRRAIIQGTGQEGF